MSLIEREGDQDKVSNEALEAQFHAMRRLVASKAGYQGFTEIPRFNKYFHFNNIYHSFQHCFIIVNNFNQFI